MSLIDISNLSYTYDGSYDPVFQGVSVQLDTDWRLGMIGRNGRGKTTLLRLLMGQGEFTGTISATMAFDYFPFAVPAPERDSGEAAEALRPGVERWRLVKEMKLLDLDEGLLYRPFSTLSNGEQTRFLLALLFLRDHRFLLIDEPTNHLDRQGRELVGGYLAKKKGFILVSHDRAFLDRSVDHVLVFNKTGLEVQKGNFSTWWQNKEYRDQFERAEREKLQKDIKRLDAAAKRTAGWSDAVEKTKYATRDSGLRPDRGYIGHKAAKMMKRSKAVEERRLDAAEEKSKLLKDLETAEELKIRPLIHPQGRLLEAADVAISYDGRSIFVPSSFVIARGDRAALAGPNGAGKSSVLKLILGQNAAYTGTLRLASGLRLSYVSQDTSFLRGGLKDFARESGIEESLFKAILRKLDFERVQFEKDMADYSGGQKKKVLIARSLCQEAHLYLWDEPLNFVDVYSRMQIEELILEYRPTMLFVEHDQAFTERVATKVIELQKDEADQT
ncbi:MAG: ABC-F type ribosomal protection protein [Clostridia bacterium]|nr:ABC-F type ribosomal protection protein [Clostridia bacterium]